MTGKSCPQKEPMLERLLSGETVESPSSADLDHSKTCEDCRRALKRIGILENRLAAFFDEIRANGTGVSIHIPKANQVGKPGRSGPNPNRWFDIPPPAFGFAIVIFTVLCFSWMMIPRQPSPPPTPVFEEGILMVSGALMVSDGNSVIPGERIPISEKTLQSSGDSVIRFPSGVEVSLVDSRFRVQPSGIHLLAGKIVVRVKTKGIVFSTSTPCALLGVRGTVYFVEVSDDGASRVRVTEGIVEVTTISGENRNLRAGEHLLVEKDGRIPPSDVAPPKDGIKSKAKPDEGSKTTVSPESALNE